MKFWKLLSDFSPVKHLKSSENASYVFGEKMENLIFKTFYDKESPHRSKLGDVMTPAFGGGILINSAVNGIFKNHKLEESTFSSQCIVSDGLEEREYTLLYTQSRRFQELEHQIDFNKSTFYVGHSVTRDINLKLEKGYIKDANDLVNKMKEEKTKDAFGNGKFKTTIYPDRLVFKKRIDYFWLPMILVPIISDKLKKALEENGVKNINTTKEFKHYEIEMPEIYAI
jgi:hypothetical protein